MSDESTSSHYGWIAVWACVAAGIAGFLLTGWSERIGPYEMTAVPEFPAIDYRQRWKDGEEGFREVLSQFFIERSELELLNRLDTSVHDAGLISSLMRLAEDGDAVAARLVGCCILYRDGVVPGAGEWLYRSALLGDTEAEFLISELVLMGGLPDFDCDEIIRMLSWAVAAESANARELMASVRLDEGNSVEARMLMEAAADQGSRDGIYQLGLFSANGIGGVKDPVNAARWFRIAAERGNSAAMYSYGRCLESGYGIGISFSQACRWNRCAAAYGYAAATAWCRSRGIDPAAVMPGQKG